MEDTYQVMSILPLGYDASSVSSVNCWVTGEEIVLEMALRKVKEDLELYITEAFIKSLIDNQLIPLESPRPVKLVNQGTFSYLYDGQLTEMGPYDLLYCEFKVLKHG